MSARWRSQFQVLREKDIESELLIGQGDQARQDPGRGLVLRAAATEFVAAASAAFRTGTAAGAVSPHRGRGP